jgi:hypothetical protein
LALDSSRWLEEGKVTEEENNELTKPFSEEEINATLFKMEKNKAADPDGFPIEFYQRSWVFIKRDIMELFNDFYEGKLDIRRINYDIITLIPKTKEAIKIQQYIPIYLLSCLYKWFTKILTMRIEAVGDRIIHRNQVAFIGGRNIINNILALYEILHETKRRNKVGVVLKLDFEKAYDKVYCGFLMTCLRARGFAEKWCSW